MFVAAWMFDVQYGARKQVIDGVKELSALLPQNGWRAVRTRVLEGSIGAPESRFVIEHEFGSLADLEASWDELHRHADVFGRMVNQLKSAIVSGSPRWEVYRIIE